jgi:hypothetical protein
MVVYNISVITCLQLGLAADSEFACIPAVTRNRKNIILQLVRIDTDILLIISGVNSTAIHVKFVEQMTL